MTIIDDHTNEDVINDPPPVEDALPASSAYVAKDKEAVLLSRPKAALIEWFDVATCEWRPAQ